ncbi:MAG: transposase [Nitrobacter sp.]
MAQINRLEWSWSLITLPPFEPSSKYYRSATICTAVARFAGRHPRRGAWVQIGMLGRLHQKGRRRIGQEDFAFTAAGHHTGSSLNELSSLIDCTPIEVCLAVISCAAKGEPAWPPLALFKAMLLSVWYDLSDVKLAEALEDRVSFRRFCGVSARSSQTVPIEAAISAMRFAPGAAHRALSPPAHVGRDEQQTLARLHAWNRPIHRIRGRIEKIFGTWKRSYGLRRIRWRGLAKAAVQIRLTAIAYNLKRSLTIMAA